MPEYGIMFLQRRGIVIEASTQEEAEQFVKSGQWGYGMDWMECKVVEIESIEKY
ncbi:MAG: hypothetical protein PHV83_03995 [Bacteroidales bacterium]|nr:hypothetical protein [Bacteroidales bacterium]